MDRQRKSFRKILADWNLQWKLLGEQRKGIGPVVVAVLLTAILLIVWIRGGRVSALQDLVWAAKRTNCPCLIPDSNAKNLLSGAVGVRIFVVLTSLLTILSHPEHA
mmetsp:Transcript_35618/g.142233  ORF Transcript_35618/g.142233 Transcript_35618/m.142233 type:complete len:106 (+) Transcript_35618:510-827(+)